MGIFGARKKNYTFIVNKDLGDNAKLSNLKLSTSLPDRIFAPSNFVYTVSDDSVDTTIQITALTETVDALVEVNDFFENSNSLSRTILPGEGSNQISITVIAGNRCTTTTYSLSIYRQSSNDIIQPAYIKASNRGLSEKFGYRVTLSDDIWEVGSAGEDSNITGVIGNQANNARSQLGAVYVYQ